MKKILLSIICFLFSIVALADSVVYVFKDGNYVKSSYNMKGKSLNDLITFLGYNPGMFYVWSIRDCNIGVCFKILSSDIICLISDKDLGSNIDQVKINRILNDNNYKYREAYSNYQMESDLDDGIEGKYLTVSFIEDVTHQKIQNNQIKDALNGYVYSFKDGIMVSYTSSDGYNKWAKEYKNSYVFQRIKRNAELHHKNKKDIIDEINMQFEYMANIAYSEIDKVRNPRYNYNYALLYVDIYCPQIKLSDFNKIVNNKAVNIRKSPEYSPVMSFKGKKYFFNFEDLLIRIE